MMNDYSAFESDRIFSLIEDNIKEMEKMGIGADIIESFKDAISQLRRIGDGDRAEMLFLSTEITKLSAAVARQGRAIIALAERVDKLEGPILYSSFEEQEAAETAGNRDKGRHTSEEDCI